MEAALGDVARALAEAGAAVVTAPPGAGKTTRIPPALLAGLPADRQVLVLEPRRLAARLAAGRVAREQGGRPGDLVGWQVRFEACAGPRTRLLYLTEGVFLRRLLDDPGLQGVGAVVIDEFHERHLQTDVALAWLRRLRLGPRPDLRLVVMSATLDAEALSRHLHGCPVVEVSGRLHPVEIAYRPPEGPRPLESQVAAALRHALDRKLDGDVLVFLPGAAEIRRAAEAVQGLADIHGLDVVPLHGDLPLEAQERAVQAGPRRKVILSTNVAESSITVENVAVVIDSGLARVARHSPWSGLSGLQVEKVGRASADQRAGRAGRLRPGTCIRLYGRSDYALRPAHDTAEIHRADLSELLLHLVGIGADLSDADWLEAPSPSSLAGARGLLERLGAVGPDGGITPTGRRMLALPVHPRLARLVCEAEDRGAGDLGCVAAALLSERDLLSEGRVGSPRGRGGAEAPAHGECDVLRRAELLREARRRGFEPAVLRGLGVEAGAARAVDRVARQLERRVRGPGGGQGREPDARDEEALRRALLAGFPDRVARARRQGRDVDLLLCGGGSARLAESSLVRDSGWVVALSGETSVGRGGALVRLASRIEPDWLLDLFVDRLEEETTVTWNAEHQRVEVIRRLLYEALVLDEERLPRVDPEQAFPVLSAAVQKLGADALGVRVAAERHAARRAFVARACPELGLPVTDADAIGSLLASLCRGCVSLREVRARIESGGLVEALQSRVPPEQRGLLARLAPEMVALPRRRQVRVQYPAGQDPFIASRLQDFFGLASGPRVADGRVPLVLHLLAPNMRPVQVTTDLEGFWKRTYPQVRRELCRRYPRHAWPEDPLAPPAG